MPGDVFLLKKALRIVKEKAKILCLIGILLGAVLGCQAAGEYLHETYLKEESVSTSGEVSEKKTVVIDSGHGGKDPGKIGVNGAQEKELNLQIAEKLKTYLEEHGITVIMTRTDDERLADSQVEDLKKRVELIDQEAPSLAVCIHQNSYPQESVRGSQVFYFAHSEEAKKAAEVMQEELKKFDLEHAREMKGNTTYYMLKNTKSPIVIVECGFLSCPAEAGMLTDATYQQKLAEAIGNGMLKYVES